MDSEKSQLLTKSEEITGRRNSITNPSSIGLIHPQVATLEHHPFSALLNNATTVSSLLNSDPFRPPQSPGAANRSARFGAASPTTGTPTSGFRGPPGVAPPSSLYTAVISPAEMAQHEATNFKNVKGVYKNCRGIWAAQWTDERGQRHTKYFNPKYYATESEARHEAFKFKIHIAREIELRGGVQKRRTAPATATKLATTKINDPFLEAPYTRERGKRVSRKASAKSRVIRETPYDLYNAAYAPGFEPQAWLRTADYLLLQQQSANTAIVQQQTQQRSLLGHDKQEEFGGLHNNEEFGDRSVLTNSSCSPLSTVGSPPTTLFYSPQTFDSIFLSPSQFQSYQPLQSSTPTAAGGYGSNQQHPYRVGEEEVGNHDSGDGVNQTNIKQSASSSSSSSSSQQVRAATNLNIHSLPPGTSFCICGCGELAIAPARYSAHHHTATAAGGSSDVSRRCRVGESSVELSGTANTLQRNREVSYESATTSNPSALFPINGTMSGFLPEIPTPTQDSLHVVSSRTLDECSTSSASPSQRHKRSYEDLADKLLRKADSLSVSKRLRIPHDFSNNLQHSADERSTSPSSHGTYPSDHQSEPNVPMNEASASFPFNETWTKCYSPYSSYPTNGSDEKPNGGITCINTLLGQMTTVAANEKFREAMLMLTSSSSSTADGPHDVNTSDEFGEHGTQDYDNAQTYDGSADQPYHTEAHNYDTPPSAYESASQAYDVSRQVYEESEVSRYDNSSSLVNGKWLSEATENLNASRLTT